MRSLVLALFATVACSSSAPSGTAPSGGAGGAGGGTGGQVSSGGSSGSAAASSGASGSGGVSGSADGGSAGASGSATAGGSAGMAGAGGATSTNAKQVWVWVWMNYKADLDTVIANAKSFTHVSPALYQLQDAYQSGNVPPLNSSDQYDGLSSQQIAQELHAAGLKCVPLMYAGAGNLGGNDAGIQSVLNDSIAQQNFITAAVNEAKTKGYDGWNLDWEVDSGVAYGAYGDKFLSFLGAFKQALHQQGMTLSIDLGDWFAQQCGDHSSLIDLTQIGPAVDLAIMEDYNTSLGTPGSACPATPPSNINCDQDYSAQLDVMCNVKPKAAVAMALIAPDSSEFASDALTAVSAYGYRAVALWPGNMGFLAKDNFPADQTWMSVFSDFLATK